MKLLVLSPVTVLFMCFTVGRAANDQTQQPDVVKSQAPVSLPGPDTSGPVEKIGTTGNWVKKREWLMKAHEAFGEIQNLVSQIEQIRTIFVEKLNNTNNILDNYYKNLGLTEGKVSELFNSVMDYLEYSRNLSLTALNKTQGEADAEMQAKIDIIESNIKHQRLALDQLKLDMKTVEDLGKSLIDRVNHVDEHIAIVQELFVSGQTIVNEMWDIIDHNKARDKYYELKITLLEKIKAEQDYLQSDLLQDFDTVTQTIVSQISHTEEAIKKIEADGFFIKNRSKRIKELKLKELLLKETKSTATTPNTKKQENVEQVIRERTLTERLYQATIEAIAWLTEKFYWIKTLIFGGAENIASPASKPVQPTAASIQMPPSTTPPAVQASLRQAETPATIMPPPSAAVSPVPPTPAT